MYKEKIYELINILEENHLDLYFAVSKEELLNYIEDLLKQNKLEDKYDFYYVAMQIIKKALNNFDSHTVLNFKQNPKFPIDVKIIKGIPYIIDTNENHNSILYSQIKSINGVDIHTIFDELEKTITYQTPEWKEVKLETSLINIFKLRSLPSIDNSTTNFDFELIKDGKAIHENLTFEPMKYTSPQNYSFEVIDDTIKIIYSKCSEKYEDQMLELVNKLKEYPNIDKYIIDLRGNTGGNDQIIKPLIEFLKDKEIVTLIDKYVFSSGRFALNDLNNIGSTFVGTDIGTPINCFGNLVSPSPEIDDFKIGISCKYFYLNEENEIDNVKTKDDLHNLDLKYFYQQSFHPNYYVEETLDDIKSGRDVYLEEALQVLSKAKTR